MSNHITNTRSARAAAAAAADNTVSTDRNLVAEFGSDATTETGIVDNWSVSREDKLDLGIRDDEVIIYPARDEAPGWRGKRRMAQMRAKYGSARQVKYANGEDPCAHMDNMMVAVPRAGWEAQQQKLRESAKAYEDQFRPRPDGRREMKKKLFDADEDSLRMRRDANEAMFAAMNIGQNSPTAGMSFEEGYAMLQRQGVDIAALEERARLGGRHRDDSRAAWARIMDQPQGRSKTIQSGFGKDVNPNSALGQIQQRAAREKAAK